MKNINIPEPCSEKWNEMTPTDKGAFCQKCALDVYDFTNKTGDEIRDILTLNIGSPVCMRIQPKQLNELNDDFSAWKMNNKQSFHRAWVFTLFIVFGMTLFSCEEDDEPAVKKYHEMGQEILRNDQVKDASKVVEVQKTIGSESSKLEKSPDLVEVQECSELETLGQAIWYEDSVIEKEEVVVVDHQLKYSEVHTTAGVPRISPDYEMYLKASSAMESVLVDSPETEKITGLAYPNPAKNQTTLQINMPRRGKGEIELHAMNGQKIRSIHSGRIKKGENEYTLDLSDLETGMYLIVVYSGDLKETIKFSKI